MAACGSETRGEKEVHSLQLSPQKAVVPENESEDLIMIDRAPIERQNRGQLSDDTGELQLTLGRVTRSARKRQQKVVEHWSQAKTDGVEEDVMDVAVALQNFKTELKDTKDRLAASEEALKETKAQLKDKKKILATCRRQLKESRGFSRHIRQAKNELQKTLQASEEKLSQCKDDLFSLQGVAQIPDSTISNRFESICQQIVHWIDTEVATFEKAHPEAEPDHIFSGGQVKPSADFLEQHSSAGEHLARYHIHELLGLHVFGKSVYFFGLPEETAQLLREAELKLAELDPPRDSVAIASWRSETLKALGKTTTCGLWCKRQAQNLNNTLFKELSITFPVLFSGTQARASFYDQVLLPAVKLTNAMKASTSDYVVWVTESLITKFKPVTIDYLRKCKVVDSKSGKPLKPDSAVVPDNNGVIGNFIICLEPCLYRVAKGKEIVLQQETILIELDQPLAKRVKPST